MWTAIAWIVALLHEKRHIGAEDRDSLSVRGHDPERGMFTCAPRLPELAGGWVKRARGP